MQLNRCLPRFSPEDISRSTFQKLCDSKHFSHIEYKHNSINVFIYLIYFFKVPFEEDEEMAENEPNGTANRCAALSGCWLETAED